MKAWFISPAWIAIAISMCVYSCAPREIKKVEAPPSPRVVMIDNSTFAEEVERYNGPALVLFYNTKFWQSTDMETRFDLFADRYNGKAKFCKFHWDINADASRYSLQMLPTVVFYMNGVEIDRIKGIPPDKRARLKWNDDIELWFLKNVLGLKGSKYEGRYKYLFKNGYKLQISNY